MRRLQYWSGMARLRRTALAALAALGVASVTAACGATTPVWYENDDGKTTWTLPLVDPLADAELVVPVFIENKGPYLFLIDPDATRTIIDRGVAEALDLYPKDYVRLLNQRDKTVPRRVFEVLEFRTGDLRAKKFDVIAAPAGTLGRGQRSLHGIIGSDLLSRTIVVQVDRDAGVVRLSLTGHEQLPAGAHAVQADLHRGTLRIAATVQGRREVDLIVNLARRTSSLRRSIMDELDLPVQPVREEVVDDTGDHVFANARAEVSPLAFNGFRVERASFVNYVDKREPFDITYHGELGQNVLSRFQVVVDRNNERLWLAPRNGDLAAGAATRLARWGDAFTRCAATGCAALAFDPTTRSLQVARDPAAPARYDVVIEALDAAGNPVPAPLLRATVGDQPVAVPDVAVRAEYAGAVGFRVVDATPAF